MNNTAVPHPSDLIRQARTGNRQALGDLIDGYRPYLRLALSRGLGAYQAGGLGGREVRGRVAV
jgi:hypothetical protein